MAKPLVIVESPAKARTIARFLNGDYIVEPSIGHVRDLPRNAAEVPEAYRDRPWARLGVDVEGGFKPLYIVTPERKAQIAKLKKLAKQASEIYLATDEDREGESIAWHLVEVLSPRVPVHRMVFHEITKKAIEEAVRHPRELDRHLVDAQEARRILDRLYGYEVSPVLWRKVMPRLSAGRVQSVAVRMLVARERERMGFVSASWWDLVASLQADGQGFQATCVEVDGRRLATGKDFDATGKLIQPKGVSPESVGPLVLSAEQASALAEALSGARAKVTDLEEKPFKRSPAAPFITSTLQQEASRKLHFAAQRTMRAAQRLYEQGYITYMRTDSTQLSDQAIQAARAIITERFGNEYLPKSARHYSKKVKNAQEAHEAIRPAGDQFQLPQQVAQELGAASDEARLYELIWQRTVASQMTDATGRSLQVRLEIANADRRAVFAASGRTIEHAGFQRAYVEGSDDPEGELSEREVHLPTLAVGQLVEVESLEPKGHETQPPPRYTEATLVKALEELGVGRPSTYASILATIQERGYVFKRGSALVPSFVAFAVVGLLEAYFPDLVDYGFTAAMEDDLDEIARGESEALPWLSSFYFGQSHGQGDQKPTEGGFQTLGLKALVDKQLGDIDARAVNSILLFKDDKGQEVVARVGRYGPYIQKGEERVSIPEDLAPDELTPERVEELFKAPQGPRVLGRHPETGEEVTVRSGRFGPYVQLGEDSAEKPRRASLLASMTPETVTLEEALALLSLPRSLGSAPDGEEVVVANGRYGPYVTKGSDSRSLESEDQLLTIGLTEALALFEQPKRRRAAPTKSSLRQLGEDPASGSIISVRSGRFGPYVTDGTVNASLRTGDDPDSIDLDRALELLAMRRASLEARGIEPGKKSTRSTTRTSARASKTSSKKATPKKTTVKEASSSRAAGAGA
jgi:DNA topoisomerase-1